MISNGRRSFSDLRPSRLLVTLGLQRQVFTSGGATRAVHVITTYIAGPAFSFHHCA